MYHKLQYKKSKQPPKCTGLFILDKRISIHSSSNKPLHFSGSLDFFYCNNTMLRDLCSVGKINFRHCHSPTQQNTTQVGVTM